MFDNIEGLNNIEVIKYGSLVFQIERDNPQKVIVEVYYKTTRLAYKSTLVEALEYAYIGVRLCNPNFSEWCHGAEREFLLSHLMDAMNAFHVTAPRAIDDPRLLQGIYRTIQLKTEDGNLHPAADRIRVTVKRAWCGDSYTRDTLETTITLTDHGVTVSKTLRESTSDMSTDLDKLARKLYVRHFEE
jgi:hypothetical protein